MKRQIAMLTATLILAATLCGGVAYGVVACGATGSFVDNHDGTFTYIVDITWDFGTAAVPEEVNIVLEHLDDCQYFTTENPLHVNYINPGPGTSASQSGCMNSQGLPTGAIDWVGEVARDYEHCWIPSVHLLYTNTGETPDCLPLSADTGTFEFTSHGVPMPAMMHYNIIAIWTGEHCIFCDYTGPLPDCNMWSPVESTSWGTIKGLYR